MHQQAKQPEIIYAGLAGEAQSDGFGS